MGKEENEDVSISIPKNLAEKIKTHADKAGFDSISSYVIFVMNEIVSSSEKESEEDALTKDDEKKIKERLRDLGYIE